MHPSWIQKRPTSPSQFIDGLKLTIFHRRMDLRFKPTPARRTCDRCRSNFADRLDCKRCRFELYATRIQTSSLRSKQKPPPERGLKFLGASAQIRAQRLAFCGRRRGWSLFLGVLAAEALHASGGVHQLLLAGEKRMASRADFHADIAPVGGPGSKCVAARAMHTHFVVSRMNSWFHRGSNLDLNH